MPAFLCRPVKRSIRPYIRQTGDGLYVALEVGLVESDSYPRAYSEPGETVGINFYGFLAAIRYRICLPKMEVVDGNLG